jgi:putative holliday junction resolvase
MAAKRIMAIDYGTKRVGVAISDELGIFAFAKGVMDSTPDLAKQILLRAQQEGVSKVLLGLPKSLKNEDSEMTKQVRGFGNKLEQLLAEAGLEFEFRDERLTSVMANANIAISGLGKKRKADKSLRDEEAARILLQDYLDQHR